MAKVQDTPINYEKTFSLKSNQGFMYCGPTSCEQDDSLSGNYLVRVTDTRHISIADPVPIYIEGKNLKADTTPIETDVIIISPLAEDPSCDDTKTCLEPYHALVTLNQDVTWNSTSFARHLVSGNTQDGPDGLFDFGFKINEESVYAFNQTGTYQFFDLMRPWIAGNVTVVGEN